MNDIIAIQGYEHSYHDLLRLHRFPNSTMLGCGDFHSVVESVRQNQANIGIIAVENSDVGTTPGFLELRDFDGLEIISEDILDINHKLLGVTGVEITEIQSHVVALNQCRSNISALKNVERIVEVNDTATASKNVSELVQNGIKNVAAICSYRAAKEAIKLCPELSILDEAFNDSTPNETRFLTFQKSANNRNNLVKQANKTTIILRIPDKDGSLAKVLQIFVKHKMGFSYIEASQFRTDSRKDFVVVPLDINHGWNSDEFVRAREELIQIGANVDNLGSYKAGKVLLLQ